MKIKSLLSCLVAFLIGVLTISSAFAQSNFTISGYIKDASNGEHLIGSTIYVKELSTGTTANVYGFYSLTLPKGSYTLIYSIIGYDQVTRTISLESNTKIDIELSPKKEQLNEVVITGESKAANIEKNEMSTVKLQVEAIKKMPALLGEVDIIKAIQMLPGVATGGEGTSGFFVRGGGADQNLVLLDEATVYNASHLMGFFSVFNSDAIKDVQLYKGGIPAQFGGRLASVLDVRMKEGNNKRFAAAGGIGTISSRLTIEGPIVKDKGSFIISGRRSYADLFLKLSNNKDLKKSKLYFYDLNGKANYTINDNNRVFLSAYTGRDNFSMADLFGMSWGNQTLTGRWNHLFSSKLFSNLTLIYSNFDYNLGAPEGIQAFDWNSSIIDYGFRNDYSYYLNSNNNIKFGISSTYHTFIPAIVKPASDESVINEFEMAKNYALESAAYISNDQKIGARFEMQYGLRYSLFQNIGPGEIYQYDENFDTTGLKKYSKNDIYNTYGGLEPRLGLRYALTGESSLKASYNRTLQYLQLASNSTNSSPLDLWIPSSPNIQPQISDQVAAGYFRNFLNNAFESSVEIYYKKMQNQIDFVDHALTLFNPLLEGQIRTGEATAYGAEFFLRKQEGRFTGWITYTLSKTERKIPAINNGNTYPATYDRTHNLSIVASYDVNQRLNFSLNWVYYTGAAVTSPTGRMNYQGMIAPIYSDRNAARMPDYHRLDFSATLKNKKKREDQKFEGSWVFSVYNAYNHKNAFAINFRQKEDEPEKTEAVMTYLFPIIPAITYNFKF